MLSVNTNYSRSRTSTALQTISVKVGKAQKVVIHILCTEKVSGSNPLASRVLEDNK
jgi:hypothetical protein